MSAAAALGERTLGGGGLGREQGRMLANNASMCAETAFEAGALWIPDARPGASATHTGCARPPTPVWYGWESNCGSCLQHASSAALTAL